MGTYSISSVSPVGFPFRVGTVTATTKAASLTSIELAAANANRASLRITNNSSNDLYVKCGTVAATTANYDLIVPAKIVYTFEANEIPSVAIQGIGGGTTENGTWQISEGVA